MLFSAMGSLGDRLDTKFLSAYFLPAFVAMLGTLWVLEASGSDQRPSEFILAMNSVQQAILVLLLLLATVMLAFLLRTMARPIAYLVTGRAIPRTLRGRAVQAQQRAGARTRTGAGMVSEGTALYPLDPARTAPTRFGNVLAAADDYPRLMYAMEARYWWPRLIPLLPADFQDQLRTMETPMRAMLNLALVAWYLGIVAAAAFALAAGNWTAAALALAAGIVLAEFFYRAAVSQASDLVRNIWVGFDLYRFEILKQLDVDTPSGLDAERALWSDLAERLRVLDKAAGPSAAAVATATATFTRCAPPAAAPGPARPGAAPRA